MSRLARLFANTDVDDIDLSLLKVPYDFFYIHFGPETGIDVSDRTGVEGTHVEGAYVAHVRDEERPGSMCLVCSFVCSFPGYDRSNELTFGESLRRQTRAAFTVLSTDRTVATSLRDVGFDGDLAISEATDAMRSAVRMLVNGLCYLGMPRKDVVEKWPDDAPETWVRGAERPNPGDSAKYRERLNLRGFTKVSMCGLSLRVPGMDGNGSGIEVESYWRRGHWRQQPYGPASSQRKLIWLLPTVVNPHLGPPERGKIYEVDEEEAEGFRL